MKRSAQSEQHGWILPTTLFGITLIVGTIRLLCVDTTGVSRIYGDIRQSQTSRQQALREILSTADPKPRCEKRTITVEETKLDYEVCGERRIPFMIVPPTGQLPLTRLDYDALFTTAVPCPSAKTNNAAAISDKVQASQDCAIPPLLQGELITLENLRGETTRVIARTAQASVMASPGEIAIAETLTLESDLVVVAGGDVEISSITTPSERSHKVTIISALGAVRVGFVSPGISVIAVGRSTLEVPETPQSAPFPMPPQRRHGIVGIRSIWE
jgi:hypothetical protein